MDKLDIIKENILKILSDSDGYVTCVNICQNLEISRETADSAIQELQSDGYAVHKSAGGNSFCLVPDTDSHMLEELSGILPLSRVKNISCLKTVGSTNSVLKNLAENGAEDGSAVIASAQTKGRGRRGNSFLSLDEKGLYLSFLMRPDTSPADTASITAWTAVAAAAAVEAVCGVQPGIKSAGRYNSCKNNAAIKVKIRNIIAAFGKTFFNVFIIPLLMLNRTTLTACQSI